MTRLTEIQKTKDGMCRRIAARFDAHHRRIKERRDHDTPREVCCSSFAFKLKGGDFQVANSYRVSIVAKSARGGAGNFREREGVGVGVGVEVKVRGMIERSEIAEGLREQWNWQ